jgi:hypothetical protein
MDQADLLAGSTTYQAIEFPVLGNHPLSPPILPGGNSRLHASSSCFEGTVGPLSYSFDPECRQSAMLCPEEAVLASNWPELLGSTKQKDTEVI